MIAETVERVVVQVEVGDDCLVHVKQRRKRVSLSPAEALQLSQELAEEALRARRMLEERAGRERARIAQRAAGGFDGSVESALGLER